MLKSINIGTSGLVGFSKGLETISQNVANLNTPGYKGSSAQFTALFDAGDQSAGNATGNRNSHTGMRGGAGMAVLPSVIDFGQGQVSQTGNDLDVAIDGSGFFVLHDDAGNASYTRDGRFSFNSDGLLVNQAGLKAQALGTDGALHDITLEGARNNPASATKNIKLSGTLSTADTTKIVSGINVTDAAGGSHTLSVEFKNNTAATAGSWLVTVKDGATTVGSGEIRYANGVLDPTRASVAVTYAPAGVASLPLTFTVDAASTSAASGSSTMAASSVDGYGLGVLTSATFDSTGTLVISYSNGQTAKNQTLALANVASTAELEQASGNTYTSNKPQSVTLGVAKGSGTSIAAGSVEGSNVDLSTQFSAIIITQRGYQASSELVSTANEMLDTLMRMKG
ncbi:flagellar hook protein FlgE [Pseudoduganella ginsengisoli]|uniref:Flagellar basal-body rod protein FlgF n=1 Tax=Pseudoduganella ginsengisoli TaxID=1462440 RepID=A0A6L6QA56_9BURK|nr:flagellar basal-body rod protein FlgF [Pseudoduganella ginsengisoli]MTW06349.1 flagellar basal-body rod protein FlgF [Pseudoduganella ginsengisoli]